MQANPVNLDFKRLLFYIEHEVRYSFNLDVK